MVVGFDGRLSSRRFAEDTVGVLVALFAVTQVFLSLPAGRFVDRL